LNTRSKLTREEWSWVLYDVGNSAFVLVMVTTIMPIFFKGIAARDIDPALSTAYWGYANSAAALILAGLAPMLGTLADFPGNKKKLFAGLLLTGLTFTLLLMRVGAGDWRTCLLLFIVARVGWAGANILYDAFIVDVAPRERLDRVSAYGYGWGYIGSVLPFLLVIGLVMGGPAEPGTSLPVAQTKIGFMIVAAWWALFAIPLLKNVRQVYAVAPSATPLLDGFRRLRRSFGEIRRHESAFLFLIAYFFYADGVGTVITMAVAYGRDLGFGVVLLIGVILFIQVIAFPFALAYARLAMRYGTRTMLLIGICVYVLVTLLGVLLPSLAETWKTVSFWAMAFLVGSSMGGIQALSRSYFGKLIPAECSGEFFGFYNMVGKFAAICGPFLMGAIGAWTGNTRWGVLSLLLLFIAGAWTLVKVRER